MDATPLHLKAAGMDPSNPATLSAGKAATEDGLMGGKNNGSHWM